MARIETVLARRVPWRSRKASSSALAGRCTRLHRDIAAQQHLALVLQARSGRRRSAIPRRRWRRSPAPGTERRCESPAKPPRNSRRAKIAGAQAEARYSSPTILPSASRTMRWQRRASAFFMRHQEQGRAAFAHSARTADRRCRCAGGAVEIAGGLVGEQDRRAAAPWRGPAPRAAARRPTIGPDNDRSRWIRPTRFNSASARSKASVAPISSSGTATFSSAVMVGIR